ncbi:MAG TPA: adenosine deaminase [Acidimicrobiales bacterium]|nr:adenosine deaminase [Acidimicrobiales bacterium]
MAPPNPDELGRFPKVLLHDHLDGGLRLSTLRELSADLGLAVPVVGPPQRPSLSAYLEMFTPCVAALQSAAALRRVAKEYVEDLAADGVVYAEVRFAPELHTRAGLTLAAAVEAVLQGLRDGMSASVGVGGHDVFVALLLTAMRTSSRAVANSTARLAAGYRHDGVVGFDLAGLETGHPASDHLEAIAIARSGGASVTVHAGESADLGSIRDAIFACGAQRIGHGVRLDCDITGRPGGEAELGATANYVRRRRLTLEMCPSSNVHTGAVPTMAEHPVAKFLRCGLPVTVNTDNRLVSGVTLTSELAACVRTFGWGWDEVHRVTVNALQGAFCDQDRKAKISALLPAPE